MAKISDNAFNGLTNLTHLDVSYNKLSALEQVYMQDLHRLNSLNVSGNVQLDLIELTALFETTPQLQSLSIADITNLPLGIFLPLGNLQALNISGTHLGNETNQILSPFTALKVNTELNLRASLNGGADWIIPNRILRKRRPFHNFLTLFGSPP